MDYHKSRRFTTRDNDNDASLNNCAQQWTGVWWYILCYLANLNGQYIIILQLLIVKVLFRPVGMRQLSSSQR